MSEPTPGQRISYDRFWGALLLLSCILPYYVEGSGAQEGRPHFVWDAFLKRDAGGLGGHDLVWLALGSAAGLLAFASGLFGARGRGRHLLSFALGATVVGYAALRPSVLSAFPECNPARHPLPEFGRLGWVPLVSMLALYAGSGIRIARPAQIPGQALAGLAAFLILVFFFIPMKGARHSYGAERLGELSNFAANARALAPFLLVLGAAVLSVLNLLRTAIEVPLARGTRFLLVAAFLVPWFPSPGPEFRMLHLFPVFWGAVRAAAPAFLALDACCAYLAISLTRSSE
jgi:hypothetical protein